MTTADLCGDEQAPMVGEPQLFTLRGEVKADWVAWSVGERLREWKYRAGAGLE